MGYLNEMYGFRSKDFVNGYLTSLLENISDRQIIKDKIIETINELSENAEDYNIDNILKKGFL